MTTIRITHTVTYEVRVEDYVQAGIEAEWFSTGEVDPSDYHDIARRVADREIEDELVPRWARDAIEVTSQHTTIHERTEARVVSEWQEIGGFSSDDI